MSRPTCSSKKKAVVTAHPNKKLRQAKSSSVRKRRLLQKQALYKASTLCNTSAKIIRKQRAQQCVKKTSQKRIPFHAKLEHVTAFVDVWNENQDRFEEVRNLLEAMGATVERRISRRVTHCVYHEGNMINISLAHNNGCHVVSVEWLDAVKHHPAICPEINYSTFATPLTYERITEICKLQTELKNDQDSVKVLRKAEQDSQKLNIKNKGHTQKKLSYTQQRLNEKKALHIAAGAGHRIPELLRKSRRDLLAYQHQQTDILPFHKKLEDVVAFVDVWSGKVDCSADVNVLLEAMGATIVHMLKSKVTHCVYHEGRITNLLRANAIGCFVVSLEWLDELKHHPTICPEIAYRMFTIPLSFNRITQICKINDEIINGIRRGIFYHNQTEGPEGRLSRLRSILPEETATSLESNQEVVNILPSGSTSNSTGSTFVSPVQDMQKTQIPDKPSRVAFMKDVQYYIKLPAHDIAAIALSPTFNPERVCINPYLILEPSVPCVAPTYNQPLKPIESDNQSHNISENISVEGTTVGNKDFLYTASSISISEIENNMKEFSEFPCQLLSNKANSNIDKIMIDVQKTKKKPVFVVVSYNTIILKDLQRAINKLGIFNIGGEVCGNTTHVIAESQYYFTYDVLKGIARGCWILKYNWVADSYKQRKWLPEIDYEITELCLSVKINRIQHLVLGEEFPKKLFKDCRPFYISEAASHRLRLQQLIELCGGEVSQSMENCWLVIGFCSSCRLPSVNKGWIAACIVTSSIQNIKSNSFTYESICDT